MLRVSSPPSSFIAIVCEIHALSETPLFAPINHICNAHCLEHERTDYTQAMTHITCSTCDGSQYVHHCHCIHLPDGHVTNHSIKQPSQPVNSVSSIIRKSIYGRLFHCNWHSLSAPHRDNGSILSWLVLYMSDRASPETT